ncbi:hypothetical protein Esi_1144_0002 [Ectocarpus siliculosus]|uniref:Uncharacterized protein n=1 Tax=Ectocarpus siliculosus TaxID=2880 RepID=D7FHV9_ECTSI|nr:hypothetical protein Esi_1144_0002 [Ectocarpus siliculosus]|eukprot:CBJ34157.1 hypothetical protein Esi_1144_0002 [Ectocarpus siliculosus]
MRAFCYLVELTAAPNHRELSNAYHRMGKAYQDLGSRIMALRWPCRQLMTENYHARRERMPTTSRGRQSI